MNLSRRSLLRFAPSVLGAQLLGGRAWPAAHRQRLACVAVATVGLGRAGGGSRRQHPRQRGLQRIAGDRRSGRLHFRLRRAAVGRVADPRFDASNWYDFASPTNPIESVSGSNCAVSGNHLLATTQVPGVIPQLPGVLVHRPQIVVLNIGTNDVNSGDGGISPGNYNLIVGLYDQALQNDPRRRRLGRDRDDLAAIRHAAGERQRQSDPRPQRLDQGAGDARRRRRGVGPLRHLRQPGRDDQCAALPA